jgi:hypothetical protein
MSRSGRTLLVAAVVVIATVPVVVIVRRGSPSDVPPRPQLGASRDVYDGDLGDPFVLASSAAPPYVMFGTDDPPDHIPTAVSTVLGAWQRGPDAVPVLPAWASPDHNDSLTWAPSALATRGTFLLYISVQEAASHRQCIAVVSAVTATGPYVDALGRPIVCQRSLGGSIDPSVTRDGGAAHLVWKSDGNCCGQPSAIWEQDLTPDGLGLSGAPHRLLSADEPWQGGIIENPALLAASAGGWWLFYSGNQFDSAAYGTGVAYCRDLNTACQEASAHAYLTDTGIAAQHSPGGMDFFRDLSGNLWAAFAVWNRPARDGRFFCCRSVDIAPVVRR